ncbi:MAG: ABC transporter permease [Candidatus Promineofilum sp.]|nr:ABC transporter permease [Promineifilum sp.]
MKKVGPGMLIVSAIALLFLVAPIFVAIPLAFSNARTLIFPPPGWSLMWFEAFFKRPDFVKGLRISLVSATASTILVTLIAGITAYGVVHMHGTKKRLVSLLLNVPLLIPVLVIGIAMLFFLARLRLSGTLPGLILGQVMLCLPLVFLIILAALENYNPNLEDAAASLGAPPLLVFREAVLPQVTTGLAAGAALAFITSMADTTMSLFLRGPGATPLPAAMIAYMRARIDPMIGSSAVIFLCISIVFLIIINRLIGFEAVMGVREE